MNNNTISTIGRSRLQTTLEDIDLNDLDTDASTSTMYAASTIAKHDYSKKMYQLFLNKAAPGSEMFPLDCDLFCKFIFVSSVKARYSLNTVTDQFIPALKRMNKMHGFNLSYNEEQRVHHMVHRIALSENNPVIGEGKPAILIDHLEEIVSHMKGAQERYRDASLFLFSINCGSRGVSCEYIRIMDIINVMESSLGNVIVAIRVTVVKGAKVNHVINIEGQFESTMNKYKDPVYWFEN